MARRSSFLTTLRQVNRAITADQKRREKFALQQKKQKEQQQRAITKNERIAYVNSQIGLVSLQNRELTELISKLQQILSQRNSFPAFDIERLKEQYTKPEFQAPNDPLPLKPELHHYQPKRLSFLLSLFPWKVRAFNEKMINSEPLYQEALKAYNLKIEEHENRVMVAYQNYLCQCELDQNKVDENNKALNEIIQGYTTDNAEFVNDYLEIGLEHLSLPDGCLSSFEIEYDPMLKQATIDYLLPKEDIIPEIETYIYRKTNDEITQKNRRKNETKKLHKDLKSNLIIRVVYEIFRIDKLEKVQSIIFHAYEQWNDDHTNKEIKSNTISIKATRDLFLRANLDTPFVNELVNSLKIPEPKKQEKLGLISNIAYQQPSPILQLNTIKQHEGDSNGIVDSSIIDVTGQPQQLQFNKADTDAKKENFEWVNERKDLQYECESWRLGNQLDVKLNLSKDHKRILNWIYYSKDGFSSIEYCFEETIKLFCLVFDDLFKLYSNEGTTLSNKIIEIADIAARKEMRYHKGSANYKTYVETQENEIYVNILMRCDNAVRKLYDHNRLKHVSCNYANQEAKTEFDTKISFITNVIDTHVSTISLPDEKTEVELNIQNAGRWKTSFSIITSKLNKDTFPECIVEIEHLIELNRKNRAIDNIFYESCKIIYPFDKLHTILYYLKYVHANIISGKERKVLPRIVLKKLFATQDEQQSFDALISDLITNKNLEKAIENATALFGKKRKKFELDISAIQEIKTQLSDTVEILNEILHEEDQPKIDSPVLSAEETEEVEPSDMNDKNNEIKNIFSQEFLNTDHRDLLKLFESQELRLTMEEVNNFAKSRNLFKNQLIDGLNEYCFEYLDDVIIEETDDGYEINQDYYNKIIN